MPAEECSFIQCEFPIRSVEELRGYVELASVGLSATKDAPRLVVALARLVGPANVRPALEKSYGPK